MPDAQMSKNNIYNGTPTYGHFVNADTSLLRPPLFVLAKHPMHFLQELPVNAATSLTRPTAAFWNLNPYNPLQFYPFYAATQTSYVHRSVVNSVCADWSFIALKIHIYIPMLIKEKLLEVQLWNISLEVTQFRPAMNFYPWPVGDRINGVPLCTKQLDYELDISIAWWWTWAQPESAFSHRNRERIISLL